MALIGGIAGGVLLVVLVFYKELLFTSDDATMAAASGIPVRFLQYLLPVLVGVTTIASLKVVGIVLVLRLPAIIAGSVAVGVLATVLGLYLSFYAELPSGPSIAMVATGLFLLALLLSPAGALPGAGGGLTGGPPLPASAGLPSFC